MRNCTNCIYKDVWTRLLRAPERDLLVYMKCDLHLKKGVEIEIPIR